MDVLGWIWWVMASLVGLAWSLAWFLLGGWVSTLAQIGVLVLLVFGYKYGWRRAPQELLARLGGLGWRVWAWLRSRDPAALPPAVESAGRGRSRAGFAQRHEPGDVRINVSTTMSLLMIAGLGALAAL
jgi:hypothetical protein